MRTIVIGRSPFADIVVADASVAPHHAELIITGAGLLYLVDCASTSGTWRRARPAAGEEGAGAEAREWEGEESGAWRPIRQSFILPDEPLRFGDYACTGASLLRLVQDGAPTRAAPALGAAAGSSPSDGGRQPLRGRVERDALTGEIVRRRP